MKRVLFLCLAVASLTAANAQLSSGTYKPFKFDVAFGGAIPQGSGAKGGVLFSLEPKYAILDQMVVGLRIEGALTARGYTDGDGTTVSAKVAANASYLATYDYYFTNLPFRPFTGTGVGVFNLASASVDGNNSTASIGASTKFGGMVRAGFEVGHFRMAVEYNFIGKSQETQTDGTNTVTITSKNGYMGVKLGFFFGGGKAK